MKTGNTRPADRLARRGQAASMEPGHEDREYKNKTEFEREYCVLPQWSPVMKTGNTTSPSPSNRPDANGASMEPGHEDREYKGRHRAGPPE